MPALFCHGWCFLLVWGSLLLLLGSGYHHASAAVLNYQDTAQDFWEPLAFTGGLQTILATKGVFWQDSSIQGKILTIGGSVDPSGVNFNVTNAVYQLDVATERWSDLAPGGDIFTGRATHLAVVLENNGVQYVAVYGGSKSIDAITTPMPIQDFALLNLNNLTWQNMGMDVTQEAYGYYYYSDRSCCATCDITDCPSKRHDPSGLVFEDDLRIMYVYGGVADGTFLSDLWKYDIATNTWSQMTVTNTITPARAGSAVQALSQSAKKRIVVFAGYYLGGPIGATTVLTGNDLWVLEEESPDTWIWTKVMAATASGPEGRTSPLNVLVNSFMFVWGGGSINTTTILRGPMWVLDTTQNNVTQWTWQSLTLAPPGFEPIPLSGPGLVYINSTRTMTSIGGSTTGAISVADLYRFHPLGLLPPISYSLPDVPEGYDFNLDNDTTTVFDGTSPSFNIIARQTSAALLTTSFGQLIEVTPSGQQVAMFDLSPTNGFLLLYNIFDPKLGYKVTVFTRHAVPGSGGGTSSDAVSVRFEFYQYATDTDVATLPPGSTLTPQQFFVGEGDLKFNVRVNNWPFAASQNGLILTMAFAFPSQVSLTALATTFGTAYTFTCAEGSTALNVLADSVNDYNTYRPVVTDITLTSSTTATLKFTFRSFTNNVFFDPSLGALITPGTGSGDGDGSSNTPIYIGVFVSVGAATLIVLTVLGVSIAVILWIRHTHQTTLRGMQAQISETDEGIYE